MSKYYAGIGSRDTPTDILLTMRLIAEKLNELEYTLRSGGAMGADSAFELGSTNKEIYLPWKGFNNKTSNFTKPSPQAYSLASKYHKSWLRLSAGAKKLMARNCHQILGYDLTTPCEFVVCWTSDGCESNETRTRTTGGTGQAISVASSLNIPVFNLKNEDALARLSTHLNFDFTEYLNEKLMR